MIDEDHRTLILRVSYLNPNLNIKKKKEKYAIGSFAIIN